MSVYTAGYRGLGTGITLLPLVDAFSPIETEQARLYKMAVAQGKAEVAKSLEGLKRWVDTERATPPQYSNPKYQVAEGILSEAAKALGTTSSYRAPGSRVMYVNPSVTPQYPVLTPVHAPPTASLTAPGMLGLPRWAILGGALALAAGLVWFTIGRRR